MSEHADAALITGASGGIGRALALVFAEHDYDVVLVARSEGKLRELAKEIKQEHDVQATVLPADLSVPGAPQKLFEAIEQAGINVEVLVNNAGVAVNGLFHETALEEQLRLVELNVTSLVALTHMFVGPMVEQGSGRILNVASIFSFFPTPQVSTYGASKAFVLSFTEALSQELKGTGVTATALCPGYTETDMIHGALEKAGQQDIEGWIPSFVKMSPEDVAREGYKACMKGKTIHMDRWSNELTAQWVKLQPRWLVREVGGLFSRLARQ